MMTRNKIIQYIVLVFFPFFTHAQEIVWDENEVLQYGFTYPLETSFGLENKEITSIQELNTQIQDFFIPADLYFNAYNDLEVDSATKKTDDIFYVEYSLGGNRLKSYSLYRPAFKQDEEFTTATVIIPGSGENQSIQIFNEVGYHLNIASDLAHFSDVFIASKPNQGYLALHRGGSKLDYTFLVNYMLNNGGSYSVSYLVNTLTTVKYLKTVYDRVFVVGLSQGGLAALLNSIQSSPDAAVIASGFTVTRELFEWSGFDQIIIPNSSNIISNKSIRESISKQHTNYFFSWGTNEIGTYKLEAENKYTYNYFRGLKNIEYNFHDQGHSFLQPYTNNFLSNIPFASMDLSLTLAECNQDVYLKPGILSSHNFNNYKWYRNDTLLSVTNDTLLLSMGGRYKLVVETDEGKIYASKEVDIDPIHFEKKLTLSQSFIEAPKGFKSYKWYLNGKLLEDEEENIIVIQREGKYTCCLTSDLRSFNSDEIIINKGYSYIINNIEAFFAYPNPNNGIFKLLFTSTHTIPETILVKIFNQLGQVVYENTIQPDSKVGEVEINTNNLIRGTYFLKAITSNTNYIKSIVIF